MLTESDGSSMPIIWRSFCEAREPLPLYPHQAAEWVQYVATKG